MITKITSFSSIPRFQKALYVFDIDDTVSNNHHKPSQPRIGCDGFMSIYSLKKPSKLS